MMPIMSRRANRDKRKIKARGEEYATDRNNVSIAINYEDI
jgi:hypothetical protein